MINPDNYGSLEACQRLAEAGIVVETDMMWHCAHGFAELKSATKYPSTIGHDYPALSMAEAWRMLPPYIGAQRLTVHKNDIYTECCYGTGEIKVNTNPTDALIDLLIWVEKRKEK
jgi:hypothetical protein